MTKGTRWWAGMAGLGCLLLVGCDPGEEPEPSPEPVDPIVASFDAARDPAVLDLGRRAAWFYTHGGRLPKDREEIEQSVEVPGWGEAPETTRGGRPVDFRPTGPRAFDIMIGDPASGDRPPVEIPVSIPQNIPAGMNAEAFATWWELEFLRQQTARLKQRLRDLGAPG